MRARFAGRCAECGVRVAPGEWMYWHPRTKEVEHASCHEAEAPAAPAPMSADEARERSGWNVDFKDAAPALRSTEAEELSALDAEARSQGWEPTPASVGLYSSDKVSFETAEFEAWAAEREFAEYTRGKDY